ncbi:MAG: hypothetical protein PHW33_00900 [Candidatus Portnoybacteria bacterium]|jgi:hypothetical protein|nr:hypothetical protein [Candidatus Portnoybacteria bacterium]
MKNIFKEYRWVLVFALLVAVAAGFFTWRQGEKYSVSMAISVSRQGTQAAADYKYDSYYAVLASDEFGDTVTGWFKTPEMAVAVYRQAGLPLSQNSLNGLARRFQAAKISPNVVEVRFGVQTEPEAGALARGIASVLQEKVSLLNPSSAQGLAFAVTAGEPVVAENKQAIWWKSLAGFITGLAAGWFIKAAKNYFV